MTDIDPLRVPPELIMELAMGVNDPFKVANKWGFSDKEYLQLHSYEWFNRAVKAQTAELEKAGFNFQMKMKMLAEDMLVHTYHAAKVSESVSVKLDVAKQLTKVAGLEPAANANQNLNAPSFSITISLPKQYVDKLHEKNDRSIPETITLQHGPLDSVEDAIVVDDLPGENPAVTLPAPLTNKDLA